MKVFISYARADVGLAENLRQQLEDAGYLPLIDRYDIDTTDTWKVRLRELIHACDAVVCVLTPRAAGSLTCAWEAEEAARAGKLLLPAIYEPIGHVAPPLGLANFIYFHPNPADPRSGPYFGWLKLDEALRAQAPAPPKKKLIGSARKEKTMAQAAAKPPPPLFSSRIKVLRLRLRFA